MPIKHKKEFGVYHWDTFDNETILIYEDDNLKLIEKYIKDHYAGRIRYDGADQVDIVDSKGRIIKKYKVG